MQTNARTATLPVISWLAVRPARPTSWSAARQLPTRHARYRRRQRAFLARAVPGAFNEWKSDQHPDQGLRLRVAHELEVDLLAHAAVRARPVVGNVAP